MEVKARAPGKIILAGEHAVVHGSTAVAACIDLYTYVTLSFPSQSDNNDKLVLHLKDLSLEFTWPIERLAAALPNSTSSNPSSPISCSNETIKALSVLVEDLDIPEAKVGLSSGITAFLFLYVSIQGYKPGKVVVTSELPMGSGLGSSAALCVAFSAVLLALSDSVNVDASQKDWRTCSEDELDLVNKWAFEGEKIIHGRPSGLDNTVSTYGSMIKFKSGELTRLTSKMSLKMLITNTRVGRNTKALVAGVSERAIRHPNAMNSVFKAVDFISNELASIIESPANDDIALTGIEEKLEELMEMNQGLLQCMGVSHSSIETVLRTTLKYKLTSKLTGAGGGGCVLTLLPTLLSGLIVDKVTQELEACGFQCLTTEIGGKGIQISFSEQS